MAEQIQHYAEEILIMNDNEEFSFSTLNGLTTEEISEIPIKTEVPVGESCCICLTEFEGDDKVRELICNHVFHDACLVQWLGMNITCPLCRKRLTDRQTFDEFVEELINSDESEDSDASRGFSFFDRLPVPTGFGFPVPVPENPIESLFDTVGSLSMSSSSDDSDGDPIPCDCGCMDLEVSERSSKDDFQWWNEASSSEHESNTEGYEMSFDETHADVPMDISLAVDAIFEVTTDQVIPLPSGEF